MARASARASRRRKYIDCGDEYGAQIHPGRRHRPPPAQQRRKIKPVGNSSIARIPPIIPK